MKTFQYLYIITLSVLGFCAIVCSFVSVFQKPKFQKLRAALFVGLGLVAGAFPLPHSWVLHGFHSMWGLTWRILLLGFLYIAGAIIYAFHIPERWDPGKFDIWVGKSVLSFLFRCSKHNHHL